MSTVLYIVVAIVVLLLMVLIHEFGHYIFGRMLGFKINEFSVGFGKAIFSKKNKRGELISLRLFPLGGYCAFDGEDETNPNNPEAFTNQAPWKRIIVFLGGVTFNFVTAIVFSVILLCGVGYDIPQVTTLKDEEYFKANIDNYVEGSYYNSLNFLSQEEQLQPGDVILYIDGENVDFAYGTNYNEQYNIAFTNLKKALKVEKGEEDTYQNEKDKFANYTNYIPATVRRDGKLVDVKLGFYSIETKVFLKDKLGKPLYDDNGEQKYEIEILYGWNNVNISNYKHSFVEGIERAVPFSFGLAWKVLESLWQLITFQLDISAIGGPITTISTIATTTQANPINLLILIPLISANLAIFNALPIPALDGSHIVFTAIEWIRRKPIKRETENLIHTIGMLLLFGAVILIDILHFILV